MSTATISSKERSAYWDNIKGVLILLVVFAHLLCFLQDRTSIDITVNMIYLFHMPAFVFVSGYFGKGEKACSFERIIRLVFLFFIFNSITVFLVGYSNYPSLLEPIYSYWYLIALIVWRLTAHRIAKFRVINILLFTVALLIGFFAAFDNHFAAGRVIGFYPFYMLGYQFSSKKCAKIVNRKYADRALLGVASLLGAAVIAFLFHAFLGIPDEVLTLEPYSDTTDLLRRVIMFVVASFMICALLCLSVEKNIPFLTMVGRNSLWIFILHRMPAAWISLFIERYPVWFIFVAAAISTFGLCLAFGNDYTSAIMDKFLSKGTDIFLKDDSKISWAKIVSLAVAVGFVVIAVTNALAIMPESGESEPEVSVDSNDDIIYPVMSDSQKEAFDKAFRITFAGDIILLEDQVKLGYTGSGYDFSDVFKYAGPYISSADYAIGIFEGPMAGADKGYSTSNFRDGKVLRLNFPDEFAEDVKDAGFDLVSTANNHLLDKGEQGALRTLDVLDKTGLDHTGSYKSIDDKTNNRVKLVECQGIRMAVLSYTYGTNGTDISELAEGRYFYLTSVIGGTEGELFEKLRSDVIEDFKAAKALSPDLIVVLPHIGTQFSNEIDEEQKVWFEIFKENGADIILGDHSHAVEPITIEDYNGRKVFSAYSPGNFANIYRVDQGDTSMLIDVYIDRETKEVIGGAVVPLYTYAPADGNYSAVPVYQIINDPELRKTLTTDDIELASAANEIVTEVVLGSKMDRYSITERYYINENGFIRTKASGLVLTDDMKDGVLYQALSGTDNICFIGDSVTEGTKNGGVPWYEPIEEYFPDKQILNYSKGSCTVSYMIDHLDEIPVSDLYVIALGTNDVRYRDETICAMTSEEYISRIDDLRNGLLAKNKNAGFLFIAPWYSTHADPYCFMDFNEKLALNNEYSMVLEKYCSDNALMFVNANNYIRGILTTSPDKNYLLDHIHPNASKGVVLYSEAVLLSDE
ncbi:MAG: CapA family protein [Saccharofermentans sp.]|nr:CapA family protein [Saccharofermentans sp.]